MRRSTEVLLTLAGLVAVPSAALLFHFSGMPVQPRHTATARVVAISPHDGRLYANRDYIVVRSPRGTGQFSMRDDEVRCHVGDIVPVDQQGITLTRNARTCR
jgi:hypothetical protein